MGLARLAALHGVATTYSPSAGVTVPVPDSTVVAVLAALGVDAATSDSVRTALAAADTAAEERLLPPTVVAWLPVTGPPVAVPPGARVRVHLEDGGTREWRERAPRAGAPTSSHPRPPTGPNCPPACMD